jgi:hypothetical protein
MQLFKKLLNDKGGWLGFFAVCIQMVHSSTRPLRLVFAHGAGGAWRRQNRSCTLMGSAGANWGSWVRLCARTRAPIKQGWSATPAASNSIIFTEQEGSHVESLIRIGSVGRSPWAGSTCVCERASERLTILRSPLQPDAGSSFCLRAQPNRAPRTETRFKIHQSRLCACVMRPGTPLKVGAFE